MLNSDIIIAKRGDFVIVRFGKTAECSDGVSKEQIYIGNAGYYIDLSCELGADRPYGRLDWQLLFCHTGEGVIHTHEGKLLLKEGSAYIYRPGEAQIYKFKMGSSYCFVHFSGTGVEKITKELGLDKHLYKISNIAAFFNGIVSMSDTYFEKRPGAELYGIGTLLTLLSYLARGREGTGRFDIAKRAAETKEGLSMTVAELAALVNMSEYHFLREFKKSEGVTPHEYSVKSAIERAKMLLASNMRVNETAIEAGFSDPLYFSRVFKRYTGLTPTEYKNSI